MLSYSSNNVTFPHPLYQYPPHNLEREGNVILELNPNFSKEEQRKLVDLPFNPLLNHMTVWSLLSKVSICQEPASTLSLD